MAISVEIPYSKTVATSLPRDSVYAYLADLEKNMRNDFPGVERFEAIQPDVYRWLFEKLEYGGYAIQFKLITRFSKKEGAELVAQPVPEPGASNLSATWKLSDAPPGTRLQFDAKLTVELPIPGFLKGMAAPVAQKEIAKLFDRYISRVEKNLSA